MTYQETIDFLFAQLPMYQRIGKAAYKADLSTTIRLLKALDDPQEKFRSIHLAGTNGKGSSSHMLAAAFQANGYKTALYTSPHLIDFRERIRLDGQMIPEQKVIDFVEDHKGIIEDIQPSFFELTVAMAFCYFAEEQPDIAIIETGLGGRLDSTNLVKPELSIITNIGMDHMQFLGNDLESIAREKAGIIKENTPVVIGRKAALKLIFEDVAISRNAPVIYAEDKVRNLPETDLRGSYQKENLNTVMCSLEILQQMGWDFSDDKIRSGLMQVEKLTGLAGRYQLLNERPKVICDTAHNEDGIRIVMKQLNTEPAENIHMVLGFVDDKQLDKIIGFLPSNAKYYFCRASIPRSLDPDALASIMEAGGIKGKSFPSVERAYNAALESASEMDLIYVGGSTFVVADLLEYLA